jgi:DNA-binding beta-propeller fold protein YncE
MAPLRTIQGPKTQLNLPLGVAVDADRNRIVVANDGGHSILFFDRTARGDVAPTHAIKGPATDLENPAALYIDTKHDELWVSNWGDHSATVYPRDARGNVAPLRRIRTAPAGTPLAGLGNPGGVAYDSRRDQLLVPN